MACVHFLFLELLFLFYLFCKFKHLLKFEHKKMNKFQELNINKIIGKYINVFFNFFQNKSIKICLKLIRIYLYRQKNGLYTFHIHIFSFFE